MKFSKSSVASLIILALVGCTLSYHRSTLNNGFDFPSENVKRIIKGKTTDDELIDLFGGPLAKSEISENEEVWRYSYSTGFKTEIGGIFSDEVHSSRLYKMLIIRLKNGTVTNFTYTEGH
jgi:hypothetical protein